jgi:hypothetical protein
MNEIAASPETKAAAEKPGIFFPPDASVPEVEFFTPLTLE